MALVRDSTHGASREAIERFERVTGFALPHVYRNFLLYWNGGRVEPEPQIRSAANGEVVTLLSSLFGLNRERHADLEANLHSVADALGKGLLPIGHDPGGNLIVLACEPPHEGEVFFVSLERLDDEEPLSANDLICVAKSFGDILSLAEEAQHAV